MSDTTSDRRNARSMNSSVVRSWIQGGLWLIPIYGVLTLFATITHQPDPETRFRAWSEYVTTTRFFVSHVVGSIFGSVLLVLGVVALGLLLSSSRRPRLALWGMVSTIAGAVFLAAVFGVAAFGQTTLGESFLEGSTQAEALYDAMYDEPSLALAIGGALLFSLGAILLAVAARASEQIPGWAAIAFGASGVLIGILGIPVGVLQTIGSILLVASGAVIARSTKIGFPSGSGQRFRSGAGAPRDASQ